MDHFILRLLLDISLQFQIYGEIVDAEPCMVGNINETYTATYDQGGTLVRYIHQRINHEVFRQPERVMQNLQRVTQHLRSKLVEGGAKEATRRAITIIPTHDGTPFYKTSDGEYWRTFLFIEGVRTFEAVENSSQAYEAGRAFGEFQSLLVDLPGERLFETIPYFHHTRKRFEAFQGALAKDPVNRAAVVQAEIDWVLSRESLCDVILEGLASGSLTERITHNDTKFNNVMLDVKTGKATCVVDLDTVMPGSPLYDFGDMVRTTTSPTLEDETDLNKVGMQMPVFESLARGYFESAGTFLTPAERALIAFSGKLMTFTIGLRFLTDYLAGDTYFRVQRPTHNLDRSRTQFRLVESIEKQEEAMQKFVNGL
jgi:hypothetical protein